MSQVQKTPLKALKACKNQAIPGAQVCADDETTTETPKASPGPSAGTHAHAGDSSLQHFYADVAIKNRLYDRLSKVVGAFDHAAMDSAKVVDYGVAKLKLKVGDSKAFDVLNAHLDGIELAQRKAADSILKRNSMDSASCGSRNRIVHQRGMIMFQQTVKRNFTTGFPGDIVRDGPRRAKPGRIIAPCIRRNCRC
ncbi:hypothetical protein GNAINCEL_00036 [Serratia phage KKP 3709]|nr:hypothetical protein GNAINCEL_00036 [Serratia phage KKP 3709]